MKTNFQLKRQNSFYENTRLITHKKNKHNKSECDILSDIYIKLSIKTKQNNSGTNLKLLVKTKSLLNEYKNIQKYCVENKAVFEDQATNTINTFVVKPIKEIISKNYEFSLDYNYVDFKSLYEFNMQNLKKFYVDELTEFMNNSSFVTNDYIKQSIKIFISLLENLIDKITKNNNDEEIYSCGKYIKIILIHTLENNKQEIKKIAPKYLSDFYSIIFEYIDDKEISDYYNFSYLYNKYKIDLEKKSDEIKQFIKDNNL